jgi:hypothetical protein
VLTRIAVFADPWPGTVAVMGSADGLSYSRLGLVPAPATVGETLDELAAGPVGWFDNVNTVRVKLYGGTLASVTDAALFGGANVAAVKRADGAWEVLQFADAELVGPDIYRLSRLLRGQAGSEWAMGNPLPASAPFVLLDQQIVAVARGLDALERSMQLRVVDAARDHGDAAALAMEITPQPTALMPLSPVHVRAERTGAGVSISWIRRTRRNGDSWAGTDVPLGEEREGYSVDILSGGSVVRTIETATPLALYASAQEIADFGTPQTSLAVRVYQLSATVGRGFPAAVTLSFLG